MLNKFKFIFEIADHVFYEYVEKPMIRRELRRLKYKHTVACRMQYDLQKEFENLNKQNNNYLN
jgi:hypothetical protein